MKAPKIRFNVPNTITMVNLISGIVVIFSSISGEYRVALSFFLIAFVADHFDGFAARRLNQGTAIGKQFDSLADAISFGVAPIVLGYTLNSSIPAMVGYAFFLICGVLRLARFNVQETEGVYYGMPITLNALIIPVMYYAVPLLYYPVAYIVLGVLMMSTFRMKKVFK